MLVPSTETADAGNASGTSAVRPETPTAVAAPQCKAETTLAGADRSIEATRLISPLTFEFEYAATSSPASVGENDDTRELALGFRRLTITASLTGRTLCDIDFTAVGNSSDYVLLGFGETETWGTWSVARKSAIVLQQEFEPLGPLLVELDAKPYSGAFAAMPFSLTSSAGHRRECVITDKNLIVHMDSESETAGTCEGNIAIPAAAPSAFSDKKQWGLAGPGHTPIRDARKPVQAHDTADVKNYYDEKTAAYIEGFGDVFQGSRPESTEDLLRYIVEAAKIADGMKILDAGCGVCGPAAWIAEHLDVTIEAITISPVQVREAQTRLNARGIAGRINVREGDFHKLAELYPPETFDRVLFLETICHARDYRLVIEQAKRVLKPGGYLYIKDFYCQDFRSRPELLETQLQDLKKLNSVYRLVIPDIASTVDLIMELGFRLDYVREPRYAAVFGPWLKYEQTAGIGWNPKLSYLDLISGLEIFCRKVS